MTMYNLWQVLVESVGIDTCCGSVSTSFFRINSHCKILIKSGVWCVNEIRAYTYVSWAYNLVLNVTFYKAIRTYIFLHQNAIQAQ